MLISSHTSDNCSFPFPWKVAWLLMHLLLEEKSPPKSVNNILMALIFLFSSCLGRRYFYSWIIILCKLQVLINITCNQLLYQHSSSLSFSLKFPSLLHELASKLIFSFYKKCQSDKAMALELTFFATRPLLAVIKLEGGRLLLFPHIWGGLLSGCFLSHFLFPEPAFIILFSKVLIPFAMVMLCLFVY